MKQAATRNVFFFFAWPNSCMNKMKYAPEEKVDIILTAVMYSVK